MPLSEKKQGFINMSKVELTEDQKELLNLGINFQFCPRFSQEHKKAELEILYEDILLLRSKGKIDVHPDLQESLMAESTKNRGGLRKSSLPAHLRRAAKELRENKDIIVRRADKSAVFVILDREEYDEKVHAILCDKSKFKAISRNPVEQLKRKANDLISAANKHMGEMKIPKIVGEFCPGYFYGNPKIHKEGCPLRPIISQIPLPTYHLAKYLNKVLSPFVPQTYSLRSASEFIDLISDKHKSGMLASLDACNLFTNVPVEKTIGILMDYAYRNPTLDPPAVPEYVMSALLRLCTTQAPFRCPNGSLFYQIDGIAMGSPLGVLFAQAFMTRVEETVLQAQGIDKPSLYCRYVDDILVDVKDDVELSNLRARLEEVSGLKFTVEKSVADRISFLDVAIDAHTGSFATDVFRKPTDMGNCMNGKSECPDRFKDSVIKAYVNRAIKHCSTWNALDNELKRVKQILINNNYPIHAVDKQIQNAINKHVKTPNPPSAEGTTHTLFFKNIMSPAYKTDERMLRNIIKRNCKPVQEKDALRLVIFYQSPTTASLVMKNNLSCDKTLLKQSNVIYQYKCNLGDCALRSGSNYIGLTTTTLSRRITMHLQNGGPKTHTITEHDTPLTRQQMVDNTTILDTCQDIRRLRILEAVHIRDRDPAINRQVNARGTLPLFDGLPLGPR